MWPIERHALKIYTRASFNLFKKQVDKAANFVVEGKGDGFYVVNHNYRDKMPEWKKTSFRVYEIDERKRYHCECGLYEHLGILCCHTIRVSFQPFGIIYPSNGSSVSTDLFWYCTHIWYSFSS